MQINLMSFNIQHALDYIKRVIDFDLMAEAIKKCDADIIALNEVRGPGEHPQYTDQAKQIAEKLGFYYVFAKAIDVPGGGPYGNALLSRFPIFEAITYPVPDPIRDEKAFYESRCILKANVLISNAKKPLTVFISHFGLVKSEQINAVSTLTKLLENTEEPYVFMGDLNMTPDNVILRPVFECMNDTAKFFKTELLSFPSDKPEMKIDYIFTDKSTKVQRADIPPVIASDHRPHTATIEI